MSHMNVWNEKRKVTSFISDRHLPTQNKLFFDLSQNKSVLLWRSASFTLAMLSIAHWIVVFQWSRDLGNSRLRISCQWCRPSWPACWCSRRSPPSYKKKRRDKNLWKSYSIQRTFGWRHRWRRWWSLQSCARWTRPLRQGWSVGRKRYKGYILQNAWVSKNSGRN